MLRKKIYVIENGVEVSKIVDLTPSEEAILAASKPEPESSVTLALRVLADALGQDIVNKVNVHIGSRPSS